MRYHKIKVAASLLLISILVSPANSQDKTPVSKKEAERIEFQKKLRRMEPALTGGSFKAWKRDYDAALLKQDKWERIVVAAKDDDTRTSRACEVLALSGTYRVEAVPVGTYKFPVRSKGKYEVFVFRVTARLVDGKWVPLPRKIRDRKYLLVRGMAPRRFNPYCIVASTYLGGMTDQQIEELVKESCEF